MPAEWDGVMRNGLVWRVSGESWAIDGVTYDDLSDRRNDGTATGTPTSKGTHWGFGNSRSIFMDTSLQRIIAGTIIAADGTASLCTFVRFNAGALTSDTFIFDNFFLDSGNSSYITVAGGDDHFIWTPVADTWYFIVITYAGTMQTANLHWRNVQTGVETDVSATQVGGWDTIPVLTGLSTATADKQMRGFYVDPMVFKRVVTATERSILGRREYRNEIDTGQDSPPFGYFDDIKARNALAQLEDSELSFVVVNGEGRLAYEDRHHRYTPEHQTSRWTISDTMNEIVYDYGPKTLWNEVVARMTPWTSNAIATLWEMADEVPSIAAGESITIWGPFVVNDLTVWGNTVTEPVATTDYTANADPGGGGADMTGDLSFVNTIFAQSIKMVITNTAAVQAYLTALKVRGTYFSQDSTITRKSTDETSIRDYQKRTLTLEGKFMSDSEQGQNACDYGLARFKDPQALPQISIKGNKAAATLKQVIVREISDRITVQNTTLGLDTDFYINAMVHTISQRGLLHTVRYTLADATNEDFWILDYSVLDTNTKLGY